MHDFAYEWSKKFLFFALQYKAFWRRRRRAFAPWKHEERLKSIGAECCAVKGLAYCKAWDAVMFGRIWVLSSELGLSRAGASPSVCE